MRIRVRVPAQTANLGPGFDCLSLALTLYNELEVEPHIGPITVTCEDGGWQVDGDLIPRALTAAWGQETALGARVRCWNRIPPRRGLGSSAAATVAALVAGRLLAGEEPRTADLLSLAAQFEGHGDNAAAALTGGLVAVTTGNGLHWSRLPCHDGWTVVVAVPDQCVDTPLARRRLPGKVPLDDAVYNLGRVALLVTALAAGDEEMLAAAGDDRLHQRYRMPLAPGLEQALCGARAAGAALSAVSGSGPSAVAIVRRDPDPVGRAMVAGFADAGVTANYLKLGVSPVGVEYEVGGDRG